VSVSRDIEPGTEAILEGPFVREFGLLGDRGGDCKSEIFAPDYPGRAGGRDL